MLYYIYIYNDERNVGWPGVWSFPFLIYSRRFTGVSPCFTSPGVCSIQMGIGMGNDLQWPVPRAPLPFFHDQTLRLQRRRGLPFGEPSAAGLHEFEGHSIRWLLWFRCDLVFWGYNTHQESFTYIYIYRNQWGTLSTVTVGSPCAQQRGFCDTA